MLQIHVGFGVGVRDEGERLLLFLVDRRVLAWPRLVWLDPRCVLLSLWFSASSCSAAGRCDAYAARFSGFQRFQYVVLVVRSLTSLAGYVQSKGESKSLFWQSLMFVVWFSQAPSFFWQYLRFVVFFGSRSLESGSLAAASRCSSQQPRNELEKQRLSAASGTEIASPLLVMGMFWDFGSVSRLRPPLAIVLLWLLRRLVVSR